MHDPDIRSGGVCAEIGPRPAPDLKPYMCSLDTDHDGAHQAILAGELLDSWPQEG
ncbi:MULTISPECIES: hypothetical protein [unclassified Mycobacterium]|uniref:hypothetical protein n=1 Tax=unclassified Mycobacterium TaxID=2642494 RepID=UPI0029C8C833|nr:MULTISPECIES: hypothetical protein [unclassified Mycobacterium]